MTIAEIHDAFERSLHRYAMRLVKDSDRADDLVQETFIRALAHLELLDQLNRHQQQAWLYRVLRNVFLDAQQSRQREQALAERLARETQAILPLWEDVVSSDVFELIPERYRDLLRKRYLLGMTSVEIARELGVPAATVRSRLHLAIKRLRANPSRFR